MIIKVTDGIVNIEYGDCYESRCSSVEKLFLQAFENSNRKNFTIKINTGDRPIDDDYYSFSISDNNFDKGFPCFLFDSWPEIGIDDYEKVITEISEAGNNPALTDKVGWIGSVIKGWHPRSYLLEKSKTDCSNLLDIRELYWNRSDPKKLYHNTSNYMSLPDQVKLWRFLIDVEGVGWSARTKLFFWSNRVVFLVDRIYKEYWWDKLIPWYHYVPIKTDLSDLKKNIETLISDDSLEKSIIKNARKFAEEHLRRSNAVDRIREIITLCTTI